MLNIRNLKKKNANKKRKIDNFGEKKKINVFFHVSKITQLKNLVPRSKGVPCSLLTDRQNDYSGHPFRVSVFFPSTYHQGSAQYISRHMIIAPIARHQKYCTPIYFLCPTLSIYVLRVTKIRDIITYKVVG